MIRALPVPDNPKPARSVQARKRMMSRSMTDARAVVDAFVGSRNVFGGLPEVARVAVEAVRTAILDSSAQIYGEKLLSEAECRLAWHQGDLVAIAISLAAESLVRRRVIKKRDCLLHVAGIAEWVDGDALLSEAAAGIIEEYEAVPELGEYRKESIGPRLGDLIKRASEKYDVNRPLVLDSGDYGAPQKRQRLFLIGVRRDHFGSEGEISRRLDFWEGWYGHLERHLAPARSADDALGDMPNVDNYDELRESDVLDVRHLSRQPSRFAATLRLEESDCNDMSLPRQCWNPYRLDGCKRTIHSDAVVKRLEMIGEGDPDKTSRRMRLRHDLPSPTLRAGTLQDRGSHTAVRPIHYRYNRVITVREGARLMGYPDWMTFHESNWHGSRLVGNGVPIKLGYAIASSLRDALDTEVSDR